MDCKQLKIHLCLWGCLLGCGFAVWATIPAATEISASMSPDLELEKLLRGVETRYNRLKTLRLRFEQVYQQGQRVLRQEAGTLYLRKPGQMRWEYEDPAPKLFLTDGRRVTLYVPEDKRVTQTDLKNSDDLRNPMRFLLGGLRFKKEFDQVQKLTDVPLLDSRNVIIKAVPRQMRDRLEWVIMEIGPERQIRRLILKEPGGIQTEFRFEDEMLDPRLAPEMFKFKPPAGTEIVKQ
ncbi:MAG: outer membrane lipoprotein carrier protein LolA [Acidobacteria bacterium]|nr:outer membrane lipoprotein carrier protein LolA [Acidobacteriota bacterium]